MKKALLIVAVAFVVAVGGCAALGFYAYRSFTRASAEIEPLAEAFVARWNERDVDALYALAGAQGDRAEFTARTTALLDAVGRISSRTLCEFRVNAVNGRTTARVGWNVVGEKLGAVLRFTLDHGERWAISGYAIEVGSGASPSPSPSTPAPAPRAPAGDATTA